MKNILKNFWFALLPVVLGVFCAISLIFIFGREVKTDVSLSEEIIKDNHSYLIFKRVRVISVVHNPDCPCYAKRAEELAALVAKHIQEKNKKPSSNQSSGQHSYYIMPTLTEKKK